ncbi:hypothetical protein ATERTT37_003792 [Aspergillus terreus]
MEWDLFMPPPREQDPVAMFLDGTKLGYFSRGITNALRDIVNLPSIEFEAVVNLAALESAILSPANPKLAVEINVYGPASARDRVGADLSEKQLYLQMPNELREGIDYDNPHLLQFDGMDESGTEDEDTQAAEIFNGNLHQAENFQQTITGLLGSLRRADGLQRLGGVERLTRPLYPHQEEALDFMTQRENGNIPQEYRLWQPEVIDGETCFDQ